MWSNFSDTAAEWLKIQNIQFPAGWLQLEEQPRKHSHTSRWAQELCFVDLGKEIQEKTSQKTSKYILNLYCLSAQGGGGIQPLQHMSSNIHQQKHKKKKNCARLWEFMDLHLMFLHASSQEPSLIPPQIHNVRSTAEHPADSSSEFGCLLPLEVNNTIWTLTPAGSVSVCHLQLCYWDKPLYRHFPAQRV